MSRISEINIKTAPENIKKIVADHVAEGHTITAEKRTLLHNATHAAACANAAACVLRYFAGVKWRAAPPVGWSVSTIGLPLLMVLLSHATCFFPSAEGASLYISTVYLPLGRKSVEMLTVRDSVLVIAPTNQSLPERRA